MSSINEALKKADRDRSRVYGQFRIDLPFHQEGETRGITKTLMTLNLSFAFLVSLVLFFYLIRSPEVVPALSATTIDFDTQPEKPTQTLASTLDSPPSTLDSRLSTHPPSPSPFPPSPSPLSPSLPTPQPSVLDAEGYFRQGLDLYDQGKLERAIREFKKALTLNPKLPEVRNNLGYAYYKQGLHDQAIEEFQMAIALSPGYAKAYNNLGNVYIEKRSRELAVKSYEKAIAFDPQYATPYYNLAGIYAREGDTITAMAYLKEAISRNPQGREWARVDREFDTLRQNPEFLQLVGGSKP